jgi:hypothetical protein
MTDTEQHRHRCLVRQCLRWYRQHGRAWLHAWIDGTKDSKGFRGDRDALRDDIRAQIAAGNSGAAGEWVG